MPIDARDPNALPSWLTGDPFADDDLPEPAFAPGTTEKSREPDSGIPGPETVTPESMTPIDLDDGADDGVVAYAGGDWSAYEGEAPPPELIEAEIDTSPVSPEEMTGIWLTTEYGTEIARAMGEHVDRRVIGRIIAPPALPVRIVRRTRRPVHIPTHNVGAR